MIIINRLFDKRGITLVELLLSLGLLSIIMGLVFSVFVFGIKTYDKGSVRSNLQENNRFISDFIISEMRKSFALSDEKKDLIFKDKSEYYTLEVDNKNLVKKTFNVGDDSLLSTFKLPYEIDNISFTLEKTGMLIFNITSSLKGEGYAVENKVLINNIINSEKNKKFIDSNKIYYIK